MSDCIVHDSLLLSTTARINSQWHSIASAVLLGPVSANQWSELFAGFCIGWVMCLEGKLKFAPPPPLVCLTLSCSHHPSVSSVLPAVLSAPLSLATEEVQAKGLKCVCGHIKLSKGNYLSDQSQILTLVRLHQNHILLQTTSREELIGKKCWVCFA